jgi:hypothetical protein
MSDKSPWPWAMCRVCGVESQTEFCGDCYQMIRINQLSAKQLYKTRHRADRVSAYTDKQFREMRINPVN